MFSPRSWLFVLMIALLFHGYNCQYTAENVCESLKNGTVDFLTLAMLSNQKYLVLTNKNFGFEVNKQDLNSTKLSLGEAFSISNKWPALPAFNEGSRVYVIDINGSEHLGLMPMTNATNDSKDKHKFFDIAKNEAPKELMYSIEFEMQLFLSSYDSESYGLRLFNDDNYCIQRWNNTFENSQIKSKVDTDYLKDKNCFAKANLNPVAGLLLDNDSRLLLVDNANKKIYVYNVSNLGSGPAKIAFTDFVECATNNSSYTLIAAIIGIIVLVGGTIFICLKKSGKNVSSSSIGKSRISSLANQATKTVTSGARSVSNKARQTIGSVTGTSTGSTSGN